MMKAPASAEASPAAAACYSYESCCRCLLQRALLPLPATATSPAAAACYSYESCCRCLLQLPGLRVFPSL